MLEVKRSDRTCHTIRANLVFACDVINSVAVKALCDNRSGLGTSSEGLYEADLQCSVLGFGLRSIIANDVLLSHIE